MLAERHATSELAGFVAALRLERVPAAVVETAKRALMDSLGCGVFGAQMEWGRIVRDFAVDQGSRPVATLLADGARVSAGHAALANGTAIHGFELDDLINKDHVHPGAVIGDRVFIDHGTGVVIGETAIVGDDVTLYHGVTLGGTSLHKGKRHPTLKNGVIVGSGAQILGPVTVGAEARVGANAVVLTDVPPGVTMVGIPARMVMRRGEGVIAEHDFCAYGLPSEDLPDPVARVLESLRAEISLLSQRVEDLEQLPASDQEIIQPPVHKSPTPPHMGIVAQGDDGPEEAESGQQPEAKPLEIAGVG